MPSPRRRPDGVIEAGNYRLRFAHGERDLDRLLELRFEVFNLELGEGLEASFATGRDADRFDASCHHMLVEETGGAAIGTYRMQTAAMAVRGHGFYSAGEYDLGAMPRKVLDRSVEVGRACIRRDHRKRAVLFLLWRGLAAYLLHNRCRYLFGCCSLTSQDQAVGIRLYRQLKAAGKVHPELDVPPLPHARCAGGALTDARCAGGALTDAHCASGALAHAHCAGGAPGGPREAAEEQGAEVEVPPLFATYLRYGALVCSRPAIDREFKTIDYLVLMDTEALSPRTRSMFGLAP